MELDVFKKFTHKYLKENGFEKIKSNYYLNGEKFLCEIDIQRSYYGPTYYINYTFYLGEFEKPYALNKESVATFTPNVEGRFYFAEKSKYSCDYLDYTESELKAIFDKNFDERIIPPFKLGKKYLKEHFGILYASLLPNEKVLPLLEN